MLFIPTAIACLAFSAVPALAAPLDRGSFGEVETGADEVCGEEWNVEMTFAGHFMIKAGHGGDPTPYYFDNTSERFVYTDPNDPERGFVTSSNTVFKDVKITLVSGTVYRFESMRVGTSTLETLGGRKVAHDQGQEQWVFTIDTKGGSDLEQYEGLGEELIRTTGKHPLSEADDPAFCALVDEAIGD
jgi:hypothetical protein